MIYHKVAWKCLVFHGEEVDVEKIRSLIALLNTTQLITRIEIVDGYSKEEIAEITKGVVNDDAIKVKVKTQKLMAATNLVIYYLLTIHRLLQSRLETQKPTKKDLMAML